ncbi:hypothetical protein R1flu_017226 [Riccia fluitans]|uniref:GH16 domain-containing protein n=1 Tax=Riccia fluitans TaxID=41844 RepID=A0ABD1XE82_9MARC
MADPFKGAMMVKIGLGTLLRCTVGLLLLSSCLAGFSNQFTVIAGSENVIPDDANDSVGLRLVQTGGCQIQTFDSYLNGGFSVLAKLVPGYSAGTVSGFYVRPNYVSKGFLFPLL